MENNTKSKDLATKLWAIANDLRGAMDASKFKNYILGVIFYRYLSEKTENYANELLEDDGLTYLEAMNNEEFAPALLDYVLRHLGYVIPPEFLWSSLIEQIKDGKFSIETFEKAINNLIASTIGKESEPAFEKLFDDMNLQDKDLGKEVSDRTNLMSKIMLNVNDISFATDGGETDVLGTAYMILISLFASDAGKKGGEFFTPSCASILLARLATVGLSEIRYAADSCAGSGSLLLELQNHLSTKRVRHFYAQEKNASNYNLLRMNLIMHGVPYKQFTCFNDDSIKRDNFYEDGEPVLFDVQVENPPYSAVYDASQSLLDDPRYSACGTLAPKSKADWMFVESMAYHMAEDGRIAVLLPHGVLFRGNSEYTIRRHMIEKLNLVDAVIGLPSNLFHGTGIPVCLLVLKKKRNGNSGNILFIDASKEFVKGKNQNSLSPENIDKIVDAYTARVDVEKYARVVSLDEIQQNDFNLNIPRYVDTADKEEDIDIEGVYREIREIRKEKSEVLTSLNAMMKELGLEEL